MLKKMDGVIKIRAAQLMHGVDYCAHLKTEKAAVCQYGLHLEILITMQIRSVEKLNLVLTNERGIYNEVATKNLSIYARFKTC